MKTKRIKIALLVAWLLMLTIGVRASSAATSLEVAEIYFSQKCLTGEQIEISVNVDTGGEELVSVDTVVTYSPSELKFVELDKDDSFLTTWVKDDVDETKGEIRLTGGVIPTEVGGKNQYYNSDRGDEALVKMVFKPILSGYFSLIDTKLDSTTLYNDDESLVDIYDRTVSFNVDVGACVTTPPATTTETKTTTPAETTSGDDLKKQMEEAIEEARSTYTPPVVAAPTVATHAAAPAAPPSYTYTAPAPAVTYRAAAPAYLGESGPAEVALAIITIVALYAVWILRRKRATEVVIEKWNDGMVG